MVGPVGFEPTRRRTNSDFRTLIIEGSKYLKQFFEIKDSLCDAALLFYVYTNAKDEK